jgi:flagellar hook-associated protein 1 FlgK
MFESLQTFPGTTGLGTSFTFEGYGAAFVAFQGTQRANINDAMKNKSVLTESLQTRLSNDSGVNVDRELALMIELQNSYGANARMIQAVKEMFDQLLSIV